MVYGTDEYLRRMSELTRDGVVCIVATICENCHRIIPRGRDETRQLKARGMESCTCGNEVSREHDLSAHGIPLNFGLPEMTTVRRD